jgi:penicillin-binding protein 1A
MQKTIEPTRLPQTAPPPPPVEPPPVDPFGGDDGGPPERPKLKKLRVAFVAVGLGFIAFISVIFGMMMAVASDIPDLENDVRFAKAQNSTLLWDTEEADQLARLTGNENRILLDEHEISPYIKNAVIAIEDKRFYEHRGVDYRGIGRALYQDILSGSAEQGASTITQQFVKNALAAQGDRSVFQKLREAAAAYHLERKWSKQKILTQYLNSVYFGNGAYGIESAMRTYFGESEGILDENGDPMVPIDPTTGEPVESDEIAAARATPAQAALLAGMIASPSAYDPLEDPTTAKARRDLVLDRMLEQEMITQEQFDDVINSTDDIPGEDEVNPPQPDSEEPYFTTWVTQQAVDRFGADRVFGGGMEIKTTLDPDLQAAAESAVAQISGVGPAASLVTIENATGEVKALVGGESFRDKPFNLATNGHRQPGSAFKPFILLTALDQGNYGPGSVFASHPKEFPFTNKDGVKDVFRVANYEDQYLGSASLTTATAQSDNSVYAELGMKVGRENVAEMATEMGIKTDLSTNPAMLLGGLKQGVTPLEMAFAYSTLANTGKRVCGEWASYKCGPVAIKQVDGEKAERETKEVFSQEVADTAKTMLSYVISSGTGTGAQVGEFAAGKTGTTENYGDAWFCGFIDKYTTCVWVGYPDKVQPMETEYAGNPVAGGTWPASIWQSFMLQAIAIRDTREAEEEAEDAEEDSDSTTPVPVAPAPAPEPAPEDDGGGSEPAPAPEQPAPQDNPAPAPAPAPEPEPAPPQEPAPPPEPPTEGGGAEPGGQAE